MPGLPDDALLLGGDDAAPATPGLPDDLLLLGGDDPASAPATRRRRTALAAAARVPAGRVDPSKTRLQDR